MLELAKKALSMVTIWLVRALHLFSIIIALSEFSFALG
jgi:hypothetical protein